MLFKSKSKWLALAFTSLLIQSACTKDEASVQNPVKADKSGETGEGSGGAGTADSYSPVYFDFDSSVVRSVDQDHIMKVSEALKANNASVQVEGYCDERGTTEYNLALGSRRANEVKNTLVQMGVKEDKVSTISYGKEKPAVEGHTEAAWKQNRRAEFKVSK